MGESLIVEDAKTGKKVILTDRQKIAETHFVLDGERFSLENHQPFIEIYRSLHRFLVMCTGRQLGKSTTLANFMLADSIGNAHRSTIAVLPSKLQMERFSTTRVQKVINDSPGIRRWYVDKNCRQNVKDKTFVNGSAMFFGAMSQLDSLRGLTGNRVVEDEVQDMALDALEIVQEALSSKSSGEKFIMRSGTAKTVGNTLETTFRESTGNEWIVVCPAGHHNLSNPENIGERGFVCKKCKSLCSVRNGYWRAMNGLDAKWLGFRIPQIVLPGHAEDEGNWRDILYKKHHQDLTTFLNEVMAQAAGSGITVLTVDDLRKACADYEVDELWYPGKCALHDEVVAVFCTVDWGLTAIKSFTVVGIWGVTVSGKLKLLYGHRFIDPDIFRQVKVIAELCINMGVSAIGVDWGMGVAQSILLEEAVHIPVQRFMYVGEQRALMVADPKQRNLWKTNRTQAMTECFLHIKKGTFVLPSWKWFGTSGTEDWAKDILGIYEETVDQKTFKNDIIRYDHPAGSPDDAAHVLVYANLLRHMSLDFGRSEYYIGGTY